MFGREAEIISRITRGTVCCAIYGRAVEVFLCEEFVPPKRADAYCGLFCVFFNSEFSSGIRFWTNWPVSSLFFFAICSPNSFALVYEVFIYSAFFCPRRHEISRGRIAK